MSASIEVYNPLTAYNSAISKLEKNGIRATKQRRVLAKLIFDKGKRHISAENLFDEVKKEERKIELILCVRFVAPLYIYIRTKNALIFYHYFSSCFLYLFPPIVRFAQFFRF